MGSGSSTLSSSGNGFNKPNNSVIGTNVTAVNYNPSLTSGKRYALIVGCNYTGTDFSLSGCINDANSIEQIFQPWGYEITKMTDNSSGNLLPTKNNILAKLAEFVAKLTADDTLLFYYSGHGSRISDANGDEISGLDSVIIPLDVRSQGSIVDDSIRAIFAQAVANSNILAIFDSCNSGSICDLRYNLFDTSYRADPFIKSKLYDTPNLIARNNIITNNKYTETVANVVSLSGCKDDQFSYEIVTTNGVPGGALTYSLISCLKSQTPTINFTNMLANIKSRLISLRLGQNPSLMSGRTFDPEISLASFLRI
jgi:metacaspase-1